MKINMRFAALLLTAAVMFAAGCESDNITGETEEYGNVNTKVASYFYSYYLWNDLLPEKIDIPSTDPFAFFEKLRSYSSDDDRNKWSALARSRDDLYGSMTNSGKSFGYSLVFYRFTDMDDQIWAVVQYVHPDTPADKAGIKRGNLISRIDGELMTDGGDYDYRNLVYAEKLNVTVHSNNQDGVGRAVSMTAESGYLDPILDSKIIERDGNRIGYLMYTDFVQASEADLSELFGAFKAAGVTDLILDLRYNGGGTSSTALHLASLIAPASTLDGENIFSRLTFNDWYTLQIQLAGLEESYGVDRYPETGDVPENLDLDRVFVLTARGTASASEQTIIGLDPYMDVITIGAATHGKFVGGFILPFDNNKDGMYGWGMYLITFWYENALGQPGVNAGLAPDYEETEDWRSYWAVGDLGDPLISKAVRLITGEPDPEPENAPGSRSAMPQMKELWRHGPGIGSGGVLIKNQIIPAGTADISPAGFVK